MVLLFVFLSQIDRPYDVLDLGRILSVDVRTLIVTVSASYAMLLDDNLSENPSQIQLKHSSGVHGEVIILSVSSCMEFDESSFFAFDEKVLSGVQTLTTFSSTVLLLLLLGVTSPDLESFEIILIMSVSGGSAYVKLLTDFVTLGSAYPKPKGVMSADNKTTIFSGFRSILP